MAVRMAGPFRPLSSANLRHEKLPYLACIVLLGLRTEHMDSLTTMYI